MRASLEVKDYAGAVNSYAQLLELEPAHRTGHFNMAVSLGKLTRWAEAAAMELATARDPVNTVLPTGRLSKTSKAVSVSSAG